MRSFGTTIWPCCPLAERTDLPQSPQRNLVPEARSLLARGSQRLPWGTQCGGRWRSRQADKGNGRSAELAVLWRKRQWPVGLLAGAPPERGG